MAIADNYENNTAESAGNGLSAEEGTPAEAAGENAPMGADRTGLVMEGGAMRGLFTCGVIDLFMDEGITFDGAVGTSAGATFACNFKSGQKGRALRYNKRFCNDPRYSSIKSLITTGDLYNAEFCYHDIPYVYDLWDDKAYAANPMEFYFVATDVETGKPVYYKSKNGGPKDIQWIRASGSMPLLSRIVEIDGRKLLDGGIGDSIAIRFMQKMGYNKNVVILTQPKGYVKKKNTLLPLVRAAYRKYPGFVAASADRHVRYNETLSYIESEEEAGRVFAIRPPEPLNIGRMEKDPDELQRVYDIGRKTAAGLIEDLRKRGFCKI